MNAAVDELVERARGVSIEDAAPLLGLKFSGKRFEHAQPCPVCGGTDTFAFNTQKNKWNCRAGGVGGGDALGLAGHILELDLKRRATFLEACSAVTGLAVPDIAEREEPAEREARLKRLEDLRMQHYEEVAARHASQRDYRERERERARGIYRAAGPIEGTLASDYLRARGCGMAPGGWLRFQVALSYWHGNDERGHSLELYSGPGMVAPFIDAAGIVIGCHQTWIDLRQGPKFRPRLVDPETRAALPTKKMRGSKKGGVIPLAGDPSAERWLGAEGIENTLAFARWEEVRADTFYFAAGDLGNLAGPAEPKSRFAHPTLTKPDRNGVERPVMIPGPVPAAQKDDEPDAMVVPDHVGELVLLADADSERVFTASAMARAKARHAREGRLIPVVWPRPGTDFAAMLANADQAYEDRA
ncbi:primase-helicase zinc-binding domain-containing protein [Aliihoeflea sp. 40Bstr573]|uniref:DUF7146 domain-containing protein n=1 Tax=Aliihoeflea sp. 40Bstr573 TaxID=2696467 RepID=UPI002095A36F|nr:P4 alpha zinc-binding domain-containing protein [Aliihoeflea sp. 40Bstr573]